MTRQTFGAGALASPLLAVSQPLIPQFSYPLVPVVKPLPTHPGGTNRRVHAIRTL